MVEAEPRLSQPRCWQTEWGEGLRLPRPLSSGLIQLRLESHRE